MKKALGILAGLLGRLWASPAKLIFNADMGNDSGERWIHLVYEGQGERVYLTVDERQAVRVEEAICVNGELAAEGGWATF